MKLLITWNTLDIIETQAEYLIEENPELTKEEAWEQASSDSDIFQFEWEYVTDYLSELMKDNIYWKATVENFGWDKRSGYSYIKADNGQKLLHSILPDTDCTFKIFKYRNGFKIQNSHHDSPMGNEWYTCIPIKESTYEKLS